MTAAGARSRRPSPPIERTSSNARTLTDADVEAVALRVIELLRGEGLESPELVPAGELGRRLGRSPAWVRANAERLGVVRLGDGPRPRLMFDPVRALEA